MPSHKTNISAIPGDETPPKRSTSKIEPFELFTASELAQIFRVCRNAILCCKKNGAHFVFQKSRPEWIMEFLCRPECKDIEVKTEFQPKLPTLEVLPPAAGSISVHARANLLNAPKP